MQSFDLCKWEWIKGSIVRPKRWRLVYAAFLCVYSPFSSDYSSSFGVYRWQGRYIFFILKKMEEKEKEDDENNQTDSHWFFFYENIISYFWLLDFFFVVLFYFYIFYWEKNIFYSYGGLKFKPLSDCFHQDFRGFFFQLILSNLYCL